MTRPLMCVVAAGCMVFSVGCGEVVFDEKGNPIEQEAPAANLATTTQALTNRVVICAGGNVSGGADWNPASCGGTVQDYSQGWHGGGRRVVGAFLRAETTTTSIPTTARMVAG